MLSGSYTKVINDVEHVFFAGNIILLRPEDAHSFSTQKHTHQDIYVSKQNFKKICSLIDKDLYKKLTANELAFNLNLEEYDLLSIKQKLEKLHSAQKNSPTNPTLPSLHLNIVTELLYLYVDNSNANASNLFPEWLNELISKMYYIEFLVKNISEIILSTKYSHGYVCRQFKKHVGITLRQYVLDLKLEYSLRLLIDQSLSISNIADKLGYSSVSNFAATFKKRYKITPSEWRIRNFVN